MNHVDLLPLPLINSKKNLEEIMDFSLYYPSHSTFNWSIFFLMYFFLILISSFNIKFIEN
jgi:hypothetical protein